MKIRGDFVTNSSSSSFILNFKNEGEAYKAVCQTYLKYAKNEDIPEDVSALDRIVSLMEANVCDKETAIKNYLEEIRLYPVRYKVKQRYQDDKEKYPRSDWEDFENKYGALIEAETDKEIEQIKTKIEKQFAKKNYFSIFELEDHYPESYASDICFELPDVLVISHH